MSLRLQLIVGVVIVIALLGIIGMIRKRKLNLKYALIWILVGIVVLIMDVWPGLLGKISSMVGIELPINMLVFMGFGFSLLLVFGLTIKVSRMSDEMKRLTQEMAILEHRLGED